LSEPDLGLGQGKLPPAFPTAGAGRFQARFDSFQDSSRSNSARAAKIPKTNLPLAVVVSTSVP